MHLYIIRHGESLGNIQQTDHPDCGLSPQGEQQVERIVPYFDSVPVDQIWSSPLKRTIQSATPLAKRKGLNIQLFPELTETFDHKRKVYAEYDWDPLEQIVERYPITWYDRENTPHDEWWPVWPETGHDVMDRVKALYAERVKPYLDTDQHIVVFGHGATTRRLRTVVCERDPQHLEQGTDNAVICAYHLDSNGECLAYEIYTDHISNCMSLKANRAF